jgi:hypothetical protein
MINPAPYLRQTIFSLLNGNVTYDSADVPVYESEGKHSDKVQIIIGDYSDANAGNKQKFGSQSRQVIQILSQQPTATKKAVDTIGEQVMTLIQSDPQAADTLDGADFNVTIQGKPSVNHLIEDSGSGQKNVRLILSYDLLIINK